MKTTASILLLAILAFNWMGYRFVSAALEHRAEKTLAASIDRNDYDEASLILITVPLNAPYLSGSVGEFERYDGEIELQGVYYHYVKRKISNGNLELLCLPNQSRHRVQEARVDFFKMVNSLEHSSQSKGKSPASSFKSFVTEYSPEKNAWNIRPAQCGPQPLHPINPAFGESAFANVLTQPPRA